MHPTSDDAPSPSGRREPGSSTDYSSGNSGSQYALCALGVGLVALGIVMIVWSIVPADAATNSSSGAGGGAGGGGGGGQSIDRKNKASSVAFVLVGSGVAMLLLSLCLGMRNKQREQLRLQEAQSRAEEAQSAQGQRETAEEQAQRYAVPSYDEAVGSGQYPVRESSLAPASSHLPSYDDLVQVDGLQFEFEGSEVTAPGAQPPPGSAAPSTSTSTSNRRPGKNSRKLLPIKIRRIKSEKLHMKNVEPAPPPGGFSIEPLTPPPQYEDKVPPI